MTTMTPLDIGTRVTPVGVRFWDDLTRSFVGDGLVVTAQPVGLTVRPAVLVANASGVYYAPTIFGFPLGGLGAGDDAYWAALKTRPFTLQVDDALGRFSSFSFTATLPARGLVGWTCPALSSSSSSSSSASPLPGNAPASSVPLFSSSTRRPPTSGLGVIRATLWDGKANAPAAYAALGLTVDPSLPVVWSIADATGQAALIFAYPELPDPDLGGTGSSSSSSGSSGAIVYGAGGTSLSQQTWTLPLQVVYAPGSVAATYPDLCATFEQKPGRLWADQAMTQPLTSVTVQYGVELVMRSTATAAGAPPLSVLMVTSA